MTKVLNKKFAFEKFMEDYDNPRFSTINGEITFWDENNSQPQPTEAELETWYTNNQTYFNNEVIKETRAKAYPQLKDQLDMQYHDQINDTSTWKDAIEKVKNDHPKESE
tara:strand:- start:186 stop:512 length:327 start_codon:yes stop_codon:yes gene_type:complete